MGTLQVNPETGEIGTNDDASAFTDRGTGVSIAEQLMGVALEHSPSQRLTDSTFSPGGLKAFNRLGDRLTQGGESRLLPITGEYRTTYQQPFLIETTQGPIRFTQQPLKVPNSIDPFRYLQFDYEDEDWQKPIEGTMRVRSPDFYPYSFA